MRLEISHLSSAQKTSENNNITLHTPTKLSENEAYSREMIDTLPQIIWTLNRNGHLEYYNRRGTEYSGLTFRDFKKTGWKTAVHPEDLARALNASADAIAVGQSFEVELRFRNREGQYRWFLARTVAVHDAYGKITRWVGSATDIENQKQIANALQIENELIERFIATLTHDLRTPLTSVKMSAEYILARHGENPVLQRLCTRMVEDVDHADEMIGSLLDIKRIRAGGKLFLKISFFSLNSLIESTLGQLATIYGARFRFEPQSSVEGHWDYGSIRRVVENLAENAVKYGDPHFPIVVALNTRGKQVEVSVHNQGPAMSAEEQSCLFQQFLRTRSAQFSGQKGWGVGLSIVKGIAEAHGGSVAVVSEEGRGTTFRVCLPLSKRQ